ncbi:hydroxyisourate hydrolase [Neptunicella sp. SCSIO 80796]|uniref:hydroxyisourate hydrolase n=1 Tax=Neptunicella plasticusilytica TaxID=3117012 RepID=UPI003A4DC2D0
MNSLSSHVLDTALGKPAAGMKLRLTTSEGQVIEGVTDNDGRCNVWADAHFSPGTYHLHFSTGKYLKTKHGKAFYPYVDITFEMEYEGGHYHVPLLISPFGFSSYRGS